MLEKWTEYLAHAEHAYATYLDRDLAILHLQNHHGLDQSDAAYLVDEIRRRWAHLGKLDTESRRDQARGRLEHLYRIALAGKPLRDSEHKQVVDAVTGKAIVEIDVDALRRLVHDLRELDALDRPMTVALDANINLTTTSTRERIMQLLDKVRGRLPEPKKSDEELS